MTTNENSRFKMQTDEEKPESPSQEELRDVQLEKIGRRVTRISILIPCLIVVITLAVYFNLKKSISITDNTGTLGVEALSKELESKFSSLSLGQAKLEDDLAKRIEAMEKSTASIQVNLNKATTAIKYIRSARKTDNNKFETAITAMDKKLSPLSEDLETMASDIKNIDNASNNKFKDLSQVIENAKNNLINVRADLDFLKSVTVDKKAVDALLKNQQQAYQLALQKITTSLENKIESLENKLSEQEKTMVPQNPKPGNIIEKDVR
jgi:chromosome segregation ATPase